MQQKNLYQKPQASVVMLQQSHHLLTGSTDRPTATWMQDPDMEEESE